MSKQRHGGECSSWQKIQERPIPPLREVLGAKWKQRCCHCRNAVHVLALVRRLFVFYGFCVTGASEKHLSDEIKLLHELSQKGKLVTYLKYKTASLFAWGLDQEMPEYPGIGTKSPYFAGGSFYSFQQRMKWLGHSKCVETKRKSWSFFYSCLMLKKGMPRPDKQALEKAVKDAYETMTCADERTYSRHLAIASVAEKAKKVVRKLFGVQDWSAVQMAWPSISAHATSGRKELGALGKIVREQMAPKDIVYVVDLEECIEEEGVTRLKLSEESAGKLVQAQCKLLLKAQNELPLAIPQALPEPLKVRIVTKGPEYTYAALRPVQKMLFNALKCDERFMIGEVMSSTKVRKCLGQLRLGNKWLSGDYKAATDNLAIELSHTLVEEIASATAMPFVYRDLFQTALTGHSYVKEHTDKESGTKWYESMGPQARGQLMGSPVSFPLLCIANFALIWDTVFPESTFEEVQCIVNGDDCLFQCDEDGRDAWEDGARAVGLTPSIGKTYYASDFYVINSVMYDCTGVDDELYMLPWEGADVYIPFVNCGLLLGLKRSGEREDGEAEGASLGARARKMCDGWSKVRDWEVTMTENLMKEFMLLNPVPEGIPLHIPEVWGGLGLPGERSPEEERLYTRVQLTDESCGIVKPEMTVSNFYTTTVSELGRQFGWRKAENFKCGKAQFWSIEEPTSVSEETTEGVRAKWKRVKEMDLSSEAFDFDAAWKVMGGENLSGPSKRVPAVSIDDTTDSPIQCDLWIRAGGLWLPMCDRDTPALGVVLN